MPSTTHQLSRGALRQFLPAIHGAPWNCRDGAVEGLQATRPWGVSKWIKMGKDGKTMENLWRPMENCGKLWKTYGKVMESIGKPTENYGENCGKLWNTYRKTMENLWENYDKITYVRESIESYIAKPLWKILEKIRTSRGKTMEHRKTCEQYAQYGHIRKNMGSYENISG